MKDENFAGNSKTAIDFLGNKWNYECMGCAISNKQITIPGGIIYEGKYTLLGADPEIPIPGFLILTIKRHVNSFSQLSKEERYEVTDIIFYAEKALKELNERLENKNSLFMYLTECQRYAVEEFVGQLPPYTGFNNFIYRMSQMGLTAVENNHAK